MFCPECGSYAANKALRKLGIREEQKSTVVTFDGLLGGKETFPVQLDPSAAFVMVSDTAIVPDKVNVLYIGSGYVMTIESKDLASQSDSGMAVYMHDNVFLIITVEKDMDDGSGTIIKGGTYVRFEVTRGCYVSSIESTTETIHPIDQKYLPGVCLPVVDLSAYPVDFGGTSAYIIEDAETIATLNKLRESALAFLVKIGVVADNPASMVLIFTRMETNGEAVFAYDSYTIPAQLMPTAEGSWALAFQFEQFKGHVEGA